mmetsp:Transcript_123821/g.361531  ORF Transcript_123821/g.361531 Transcript_123821/m.361531 type:complete len:412 (-) Transcript_123821:219-1454(-)
MDVGGALSRKGSKVSRVSLASEDVLIDGVTEDTPLSCSEEMELPALPSCKSNDRLFRPRRTLTTLALAGAGLLVVCGCAAAACRWPLGALRWSPGSALELWGTCDYETSSTCPAPSLLRMPEVHEVASQNIMKLGWRMLGPQHSPVVKTLVRSCFENVSLQLEHHAQQVARELDMVRVTGSQKDAMLNSLRLLGDPRVESIGLDIAEALRSTFHHGAADEAQRPDDSVVIASLNELLQRFELGALSEDLALARLLWSEGRQWDLSLEFEHFRSMAGMSSRWHGILEEAPKQKAEPAWGITAVAVEEDTRLAIIAGAVVQARVLLDILKVRARSAVPFWVTSLSGYLGVSQKDISCDLNESHAVLNSFACPLKFGIQGMDALRAHFSEEPIQRPIQDPTSDIGEKMLTIPGS